MLRNILNLLENENIDFTIPEFLKSFYNEKNTKALLIKVISDIEKHNLPYKEKELKIIQLFLNHFTAYKGSAGTLLKNILILPLLKKAGFNAIMLLPHFLRSEKFRKGDRGSPYSVKDYYVIDPDLNELNGISTDDMFKAFIEASHKLGIKVFIDMVPRTAARDSNWILENPDWFYWIKPENSEKLISLLNTHISELPSPASPTREYGKIIIEKLPIKEIASLFTHSPKVSSPQKWKNFVNANKNNENFLDELEKEFGIITPPCTSDCANDPQPPWVDVTPLRLYEDYDSLFYEVLGKDFLDSHAPFFIQPILKASVFKGKKPMKNLWKKLSEVPHYYAKNFGVDGLRGDMFHALPNELIRDMTKNLDKDFILIMENLNNQAGEELSKELGFHFYTGNLFTVINEGLDSMEYFIKETNSYNTKILSMPVIGDSPPLFSDSDKRAFFKMAVSSFLPNSAFGITADTLIKNRLPLNFGLGFSKDDQIMFEKKMKEHGRKIAYFNYDYLNEEWDNANTEVIDFLNGLLSLRDEIFIDAKLIKASKIDKKALYWEFESTNGNFLAIANFSDDNINISEFNPKSIRFSYGLNDLILEPNGFLLSEL